MAHEYWRAWRDKFNAIPERLDEALQWVDIEHGRAATNKKLLAEFSSGIRSNEHFFAYHESTEIISIFDSWPQNANDFPGIQDKISSVFKNGTLLSENEMACANSNRPRSDAFVYMLAGKFLYGGEAKIISIAGIKNRR